MNEEEHVLSADCPCGPEVEEVDEEFNTFPGKSLEELRRIAIVAKARVWQATGELSRRTGTPPEGIESTLDQALGLGLVDAFLSGEFASEHDALQSAIDNNGSIVPPANNTEEVAV